MTVGEAVWPTIAAPATGLGLGLGALGLGLVGLGLRGLGLRGLGLWWLELGGLGLEIGITNLPQKRPQK